MKTTFLFRILTVVIALFFLSALSSYAGKPEIAPAVHLQKIIQQSITYPAEAVKHCCTGSVKVIFAIDETGKIDIKKMSTDNQEIAEEVKSQLSKINYKDVKVPSYQLYKITISFKLVG